MEGVMLPYLPTALWILTGAMVIMLLLVVFGYYVYWRKRETALLADIDDVAKLAARKQVLQADSDALRSHIYALRRAIDKPFKTRLLQTVHGIGYRLVAADDLST